MRALQQQTYGFTYDLQGRLTGSNRYSGTSTSAQSSYTERGITYDKNGNILTLQRYAAALQDNYTYTYNGNKVTSISGTNNGTAISAATYSYDNNGNTTTDGLKNLQITYNILNLPQSVTQSGTTKATYGWFADGTKYSVLDAQGNGYYYIGSLIYSSTAGTTALESTDFSSGRIVLSGSAQTIHYHHKDHLGSVRAVTDTNGTVIEQNAYYPFGGRHTFGQTYAQTTSNRYKFNGKELQTTSNIGLLDYGARMYDTKIARWLVQDPLAEKYYPFSSYSFSGNNPIMNIDRNGQAWDVFIDVASLVYDVGSAIYNHAKGNHSQAKQNWVDVGADVVSMVVPGLAAPVAKGIINGADKVADVGKISKSVSTTNIPAKLSDKDKLIISIPDEDKIERSLLNPPTKVGKAPTFKSDGTSVEIHHIGQNPNGPFKEMHKIDHRGKNNYKTNHVNSKLTNIDRKEFNKARKECWKNEYKHKSY